MDALSPFDALRARPLHPLSPERVNATRTASNMTTTTTTSNTGTSKGSRLGGDDWQSPPTSPTRRTRPGFFDGLASTATPLKQTTSGFTLPQSPSLPEIHAVRGHTRTNSDVLGLVQRFEHLDVRDRDVESAERRSRHEAELRRAQIAREEAETDVKRYREEMRRLKVEREEGLEREREVGKRLDVVLEQFKSMKEANATQFGVYEKELRKARKEAFKSSSAVLKLQEELKSTRASLRVTQSTLDLEKQKMQRKEQERFEMEYQLIPLQEQLDKLKQQLSAAEEEREALKKNVKEDELLQIAGEGMIALPAAPEHDDDLASPRRSPPVRSPSPLSDDKENIPVVPKHDVDLQRLVNDLHQERSLRSRAEDLAEFMRLECMFQCCSCKTAARLKRQHHPAMDVDMAARIEDIRSGMAEVFDAAKVCEEMPVEAMDVDIRRGLTTDPIATDEVVEIKAESILEQKLHDAGASAPANTGPDVLATLPDETAVATDGGSGTLSPFSLDNEEAPTAPRPTPVDPLLETASESATVVPLRPETPPQHMRGTPFRQQPSVRTVTTTTTVPMQFTPMAKPAIRPLHFTAADIEIDMAVPASAPPRAASYDFGGIAPQMIDREAALAAIEARRGRARSVAAGLATPQKQMVEGVRERRDISAPALGQKSTAPTGTASRTGSVGRKERR